MRDRIFAKLRGSNLHRQASTLACGSGSAIRQAEPARIGERGHSELRASYGVRVPFRSATIHCMNSNAQLAPPQTNGEIAAVELEARMRVRILRKIRRAIVTLAGAASVVSRVVLIGAGLASVSQPAPAQIPALTTVVVFADRPMPDQAWTALFHAVRNTVANNGVGRGMPGDAKLPGMDASAELVRGDTMRPGMPVGNAISVYLHGDCVLQPLARRTAYGVPLGWVLRRDGRIAPFIHVDCTRIGQMLGCQARGISPEARERMMAEAMARVVVHEWIHVAAQTDRHGQEGITKASFDVGDLMSEAKPRAAGR